MISISPYAFGSFMFAKKVPQGYIAINRSSFSLFIDFSAEKTEAVVKSFDFMLCRFFRVKRNQKATIKKQCSQKQQQSVDRTSVSIDRNKMIFWMNK